MSTCENVPGLAAAAELDIIPDREEQIMYPTEFRIQIRDQLCTVSKIVSI